MITLQTGPLFVRWYHLLEDELCRGTAEEQREARVAIFDAGGFRHPASAVVGERIATQRESLHRIPPSRVPPVRETSWEDFDAWPLVLEVPSGISGLLITPSVAMASFERYTFWVEQIVPLAAELRSVRPFAKAWRLLAAWLGVREYELVTEYGLADTKLAGYYDDLRGHAGSLAALRHLVTHEYFESRLDGALERARVELGQSDGLPKVRWNQAP